MGQKTCWPSIWFSKYVFLKLKGFLQRIFQDFMKKIILGTSDTWSMSRLSHWPSDPTYYIVDWRIFTLSLANQELILQCRRWLFAAKIWLTDWRQVQLLDHHYLEALKLYLSKSPALKTAPEPLSLSYKVTAKIAPKWTEHDQRTYFASGVNQI